MESGKLKSAISNFLLSEGLGSGIHSSCHCSLWPKTLTIVPPTIEFSASVYKISPVMLMSMWASEGSIDDEAEATDGEERLDRHIDSADMRAFIRQLKDCSTLLGCIEQAIICENPERCVHLMLGLFSVIVQYAGIPSYKGIIGDL